MNTLGNTWPKRMKISDFRRVGFSSGSAPGIATLKRWIDRGKIPGEKFGSMYFVWIDKNLDLVWPPATASTSELQASTTDAMSAALLSARLSTSASDLHSVTESRLLVDKIHSDRQAGRDTCKDNPTIGDAIDEFESSWLRDQEYSASSLRERQLKLRQYKAQWPRKAMQSFRPVDIAGFLKTKSREPARQHRILLEKLFGYGVGMGYLPANPVEHLLKIKAPKRKRKRHTWEGYQLIHRSAPSWLQIAMDAALYSLQRRADLLNISVADDIDLDDGTIKIRQRKSDHYDNPIYLVIKMGAELRDVVDASLRLPPVCPYLVHHHPVRIRARDRSIKPHPFAVLPDYLTRSFTKARDECGAYDHIERSLRPSFHDIRALGIFAYHKAGHPVEYIQGLAGHANKQMTEHYREGHEKPEPVRVEAGLSLAMVDWSQVEWETDISGKLKH